MITGGLVGVGLAVLLAVGFVGAAVYADEMAQAYGRPSRFVGWPRRLALLAVLTAAGSVGLLTAGVVTAW